MRQIPSGTNVGVFNVSCGTQANNLVQLVSISQISLKKR